MNKKTSNTADTKTKKPWSKLLVISLVITVALLGSFIFYKMNFYSEMLSIDGKKKQENFYEYGEITKTIIWYSNNKKESEMLIKNNKLNGLSKWFYKNGNKKSEINFKNDKKNGLLTFYYKDGTKKEEGNYILGKPEGKHEFWYENGKKKSEVNFEDGKKDGKSTFWNEDGSEKGYNNYIDGGLIR